MLYTVKNPVNVSRCCSTSQFDPLDQDRLVVDTRTCLPHPSEPDWTAYRTIAGLFTLCFLLVLTEAYLLRLRHIICGYYYPERERERIAWLYTHILRRRGRVHELGGHERGAGGDQEGLLLRLMARLPLLRRLLSSCYKTCVSCGATLAARDPRLALCDSCGATYCQLCHQGASNRCVVCFKTLRFGGQEGSSEEVDSSEDEL